MTISYGFGRLLAMRFLRFTKHSGGPLQWGKTSTWLIKPTNSCGFELICERPSRLSHSMLHSWTGVIYPAVREQGRSSFAFAANFRTPPDLHVLARVVGDQVWDRFGPDLLSMASSEAAANFMVEANFHIEQQFGIHLLLAGAVKTII
ncbi:hypothetical protein [Leisingera sp. ANG-DT]|uniref:hypothetical protein n=1 Tax=Leisingera sp. ANG-DT TaxID=1577897 RepID=UPI0019D3AEAA|nr:hypothetical protein [Leisingera sp. ANG-DT]